MKRILIIGCQTDLTLEISEVLKKLGFSTDVSTCGNELTEHEKYGAAVTGTCANCYLRELGIKTFRCDKLLPELVYEILRWDLGHEIN